MPKFIKNELKSDSDLDDKELMGKLNDSDYDYDSGSEVELKSMLKKTSFWGNIYKNIIIIDDLFVNNMIIIDVYWWLLVIIDDCSFIIDEIINTFFC